MARKIKKAAVLGSGVMGSGIAAHLTNCGIPCCLLDIVPKYTDADQAAGVDKKSPAFRNRLATQNLQAAIKNKKPIPAFYHDRFAERIQVGNFEDHMQWIADCDWVVEVVVENIDIKRKVFAEVERHIRPGTIVSSNTSGLPIKAMVEGRSATFRKNFLVTHFFNPVRYMHLLEIISGPETDPAIVEFMARFGTDVLGKGVVFGNDTVNFIGNRVGVYAMMRAMQEMTDKGYTIEEVDAIVGTPMGRPKSAAFRTADMVGLDTLHHVAMNCYDNLPNDEARPMFKPPAFFDALVSKGQLGDKTKGGFYKKDKASGALQVFDTKTLEYRPEQKARFDSLKVAKNTENVCERIKGLVQADDRAGQFAWAVLADSLIYAGNRLGEIADDIVQIDRAMRWGFNWDMGPFETWDAVGFAESAKRMQAEGKKLPPIAEAMLKKGAGSFYTERQGKRFFFDLKSKDYRPIPEDPMAIDLASLKKAGKVVDGNTSATLIDLGDGVLCCEFHTKMNSIDPDLVMMLVRGVDLLEERDDLIGMVIGNQGEHFSAGANLMLVYMQIMQAENADNPANKAEEWNKLTLFVKGLQDGLQKVRFCPKPIVAAPFGMTLGGGAETSMAAHRICAHTDLFMGLVELGVGIIPGGGGNKELLIRALEGAPEGVRSHLYQALQHVFTLIATAKVSMSAHEAQAWRFLRPTDKIVANKDQLIGAAKRMVMAMHVEGFQPPEPVKLNLPGDHGYATLKMVIDSMCKQHQVTEHEQVMAETLAFVLCGGHSSENVAVSEQHLLDLEREGLIKLAKTPKTQERMQHFLTTNKPLRN